MSKTLKSFEELKGEFFTEKELAEAAKENAAEAKALYKEEAKKASDYQDDLEKLAKECEEKFFFYTPGDMKKMTKYIKSKGWDVANISHNSNYNGWGVAVTRIQCWVPGTLTTISASIEWG